MDFPDGPVVKNLPCNAKDVDSIPAQGNEDPMQPNKYWWLSGKESACQRWRLELELWVRKIPWRRKWQPTPVFLPGESHGQRSLVGYSPWIHRRVRHNLATKQQ